MNALNDNRRIFATVTRNGIAVLFAAWLQGGTNILKKDLEYITGLTDKPVAEALRILQAENFIYHTRQGWSLTRGGLQMFLPEPTRKYSESLISIKDSINTEYKLIESTNTSDSEIFRVAELGKALDSAGIANPARSLIMDIPGLTADHVTRWEKIKRQEIDAVQKAGKTEAYYSPGLLIAHLKSLPENPPMPPDLDELQSAHRARHNIPVICPECNAYPCQCDEDDQP